MKINKSHADAMAAACVEEFTFVTIEKAERLAQSFLDRVTEMAYVSVVVGDSFLSAYLGGGYGTGAGEEALAHGKHLAMRQLVDGVAAIYGDTKVEKDLRGDTIVTAFMPVFKKAP